MHTERDDREILLVGMVIYGLNDFIACQMKENSRCVESPVLIKLFIVRHLL